ncbi:acyl-CoA N-acyltransferase [Thozetella sp. PMI_491]|nr:acyl-CoA N-acyltransferase [Thozetella sp. PMI_491]
MEEMTSVFATAFRSKRLLYRAVENNDVDKDWMYRFGPADPVSWGLASPTTFRDVSKNANLQQITKMLEGPMLLLVLICLPSGETTDSGQMGFAERLSKERINATPIGSLTLSPPREGFVPTTRIGISISEPYQNQGYGAEAIEWAVDWAFKFANMHKVEIGTVSYNERAAHLYEKLGFVPEGRRREVVYMNRKYWDMQDFGMLEREWKKLRGLD